jgi:hypothetical protein
MIRWFADNKEGGESYDSIFNGIRFQSDNDSDSISDDNDIDTEFVNK